VTDPWWTWLLALAWCNRRGDPPDAIEEAGARARAEQPPATQAIRDAKSRADMWRALFWFLLLLIAIARFS